MFSSQSTPTLHKLRARNYLGEYSKTRPKLSTISIYGSTALVDLGRFFSFLILYTLGRIPWTRDQPVARPLPTQRTTHTQNKRIQTSMPWTGFEPTIPALERAKTVHALDRAATVIDRSCQLSNCVLPSQSALAFLTVYFYQTWYNLNFRPGANMVSG
jgi:hypothetical protein